MAFRRASVMVCTWRMVPLIVHKQQKIGTYKNLDEGTCLNYTQGPRQRRTLVLRVRITVMPRARLRIYTDTQTVCKYGNAGALLLLVVPSYITGVLTLYARHRISAILSRACKCMCIFKRPYIFSVKCIYCTKVGLKRRRNANLKFCISRQNCSYI